MQIFKRIFLKCFYCKKKIDKKSAFELKYNAADGIGSVHVCEKCSNDLIQYALDVKDFYKDD